jgi:CBS domain-containing protein
MKVKDLMTTEAQAIGASQSLSDAACLMWEHDIGCVPVVDDSRKVLGMLTDRDIAMSAFLNGKTLGDIASATARSKNAVCCSEDDDVETVMKQMGSNQVHRMPVVNGDAMLVGILSLNDCAKAYRSGNRSVKAKDISDTLASICEHAEQHLPQFAVAS